MLYPENPDTHGCAKMSDAVCVFLLRENGGFDIWKR